MNKNKVTKRWSESATDNQVGILTWPPVCFGLFLLISSLSSGWLSVKVGAVFVPPTDSQDVSRGSVRLPSRAATPAVSPWFVTPLWTAKLWNHAPITSHLICITLITTERATLSVNANLLINKLIRQLQLCRRMPKWNMTTQSLSTAPVGLFRCHSEEHDDKVSSLHSQALIPAPVLRSFVKILSFFCASG